MSWERHPRGEGKGKPPVGSGKELSPVTRSEGRRIAGRPAGTERTRTVKSRRGERTEKASPKGAAWFLSGFTRMVGGPYLTSCQITPERDKSGGATEGPKKRAWNTDFNMPRPV